MVATSATAELPVTLNYAEIQWEAKYNSIHNISDKNLEFSKNYIRTLWDDIHGDIISDLNDTQLWQLQKRLILNKFDLENEKYFEYITIPYKNYFEVSQNLAINLAQIRFSKIVVEFIPYNIISIKLLMPGNIKIEFTHYLNEDGINPYDTYFGIFENRKLISTGQVSLPIFVEDIKESFAIK